MDNIERLKHLIDHWFEHNAEHARTYLHWAEAADEKGNPELASVLRQMAEESEKMEELLKRAKKLS